jgi:hypothetical protein
MDRTNSAQQAQHSIAVVLLCEKGQSSDFGYNEMNKPTAAPLPQHKVSYRADRSTTAEQHTGWLWLPSGNTYNAMASILQAPACRAHLCHAEGQSTLGQTGPAGWAGLSAGPLKLAHSHQHQQQQQHGLAYICTSNMAGARTQNDSRTHHCEAVTAASVDAPGSLTTPVTVVVTDTCNYYSC